jgi:hypothetical protein
VAAFFIWQVMESSDASRARYPQRKSRSTCPESAVNLRACTESFCNRAGVRRTNVTFSPSSMQVLTFYRLDDALN